MPLLQNRTVCFSLLMGTGAVLAFSWAIQAGAMLFDALGAPRGGAISPPGKGVSRALDPVRAHPDPEGLELGLRLRAVYRAIGALESGWDPRAVRGEAVGYAQIKPILVRDINRILKAPRYRLQDRLDPEASFEMFLVYCLYYYPQGTDQDWFRAWREGPDPANWTDISKEYAIRGANLVDALPH